MMPTFLQRPRSVDAVLLTAIFVDVVLVLLTAVDYNWWFVTLHGSQVSDPFAVALLYRAAAHWTAFAVFQIAGLLLWRSSRAWLLIVAGLRFSDVFTDWAYLATSPDTVGLGFMTLASPAVLNWGMGLYLFWFWHNGHGTKPAS
jgi:hypothetical protein